MKIWPCQSQESLTICTNKATYYIYYLLSKWNNIENLQREFCSR